jgi:gas vesicle protein
MEVVLISTKVDMFFDMIVGMVLGMIVGMAASPLMTKAIRSVKQRRKVSRMLHEISDLQKNGALSYGDQVL